MRVDGEVIDAHLLFLATRCLVAMYPAPTLPALATKPGCVTFYVAASYTGTNVVSSLFHWTTVLGVKLRKENLRESRGCGIDFFRINLQYEKQNLNKGDCYSV